MIELLAEAIELLNKAFSEDIELLIEDNTEELELLTSVPVAIIWEETEVMLKVEPDSAILDDIWLDIDDAIELTFELMEEINGADVDEIIVDESTLVELVGP